MLAKSRTARVNGRRMKVEMSSRNPMNQRKASGTERGQTMLNR